jgi:hypothetical protein
MTEANRGGYNAANDVITRSGKSRGAQLRLMVVGINSFNRRSTQPSGHVATPHIVFQFQNDPVLHRMNATNTNVGGYPASEMRTYLVGNFLTGLKNAGLPEAWLWAPKRIVWKGWASSSTIGTTGVDEVVDKLWLPTEREMFGNGPWMYNADTYGPYSNGTYESAANQAYLEYYDSNAKRIKYQSSSYGARYNFSASPYSGSAASFCFTYYDGGAGSFNASSAGGVAPAFCVK